ncbi:hypothetical protein BJ322DRAFT_1050628 [Thelephora terrestris]|uniref:Uncharacterized protein n=1 Tax=Thelephora terrestris TaxID=56493 RepID=A0A9P6HK90_9AGAM|nr:hypothetical protein BJ322DRAFT_1050628 [Thelephora terrestris]
MADLNRRRQDARFTLLLFWTFAALCLGFTLRGLVSSTAPACGVGDVDAPAGTPNLAEVTIALVSHVLVDYPPLLMSH